MFRLALLGLRIHIAGRKETAQRTSLNNAQIFLSLNKDIGTTQTSKLPFGKKNLN